MYYIMKYNDRPAGTGYMEIEDGDHYDDFMNWGIGRLEAAEPPDKVVIDVVPFDGYQGEPDEISDSNVPLMSDRLHTALIGAGVDNIIYHPVELRNTLTDQRYPYFAFKLLGLISATDISASDISSYDGDFIGDSSIKNLVLDESKIHGLYIFRLAENFEILVHEKIRTHIESCGIDTLKFIAPEDYYSL